MSVMISSLLIVIIPLAYFTYKAIQQYLVHQSISKQCGFKLKHDQEILFRTKQFLLMDPTIMTASLICNARTVKKEDNENFLQNCKMFEKL